MVSLWPWRRGDNTSPASFEKALSTLATKITTTQTQLDRTRSTSRRVTVLWTLYLSFAYMVYAIVVGLVVGWKNLGTWEWTGVAGSPVVIYATRTILVAFFNYRIKTLDGKLKEQQAERAKTIQRLKDATKFDSTQELLRKYGEVDAGSPKHPETPGARDQKQEKAHGRTNMPPPATANIHHGRAESPSSPSTPHNDRRAGGPQMGNVAESPVPLDASTVGFGAPPSLPGGQYAPIQHGPPETHWYDRVLDLVLGEDETAARNRIVLICNNCRLVNGQAPPGTKSLSEIGMWKCMGCGAPNGEVDEGKRIVRELLQESRATDGLANSAGKVDAVSGDGEAEEAEEVETGEANLAGSETMIETKNQSSGAQPSVRKRNKNKPQ